MVDEVCPLCGWDESGCCRMKHPEDIEEAREAVRAAAALLKNKELAAAESNAWVHGHRYSEDFAAQVKKTWAKIKAVLRDSS